MAERIEENAVAAAASLMKRFAANTGLSGEAPQRRYLWTDAYAVCNLLELSRRTGQACYHELALRLVVRVHHVLGRHRGDDARRGWLSGLGDEEGERHPTRGGLRIGKKLPERGPDEPFDERLEWERDGQYFHYLTRWMQALDSVARATRQSRYNLWARELAKAGHDAFVHGPPSRSGRRMAWKMSIDLSRPLVSSMGHHDPLDGFLACAELRTTAEWLHACSGPALQQETSDFLAMIDPRHLVTADPLGLGGLLADAARVAELTEERAMDGSDLMETLLAAAHQGLAFYARQPELSEPASRRLAFRELGLAIGLSAIRIISGQMDAGQYPRAGTRSVRSAVEALDPFLELEGRIRGFWMDPAHRSVGSWTDHQDINDVMLASSLVPESCMRRAPAAAL